jgi:hypothetical protein
METGLFGIKIYKIYSIEKVQWGRDSIKQDLCILYMDVQIIRQFVQDVDLFKMNFRFSKRPEDAVINARYDGLSVN